MPTVPTASDIRTAVAAQPSVGQGVSALLRAFVSAAHEAVDLAKPERLKEMVASIRSDMQHWHDAVLVNTPHAHDATEMHALVSTDADAAFADPAPLTLKQQAVTAEVSEQAAADEAAQKQAKAAEQDAAAREQAAAEMAAAKERSERDQAAPSTPAQG